jgi:hypothetical protein
VGEIAQLFPIDSRLVLKVMVDFIITRVTGHLVALAEAGDSETASLPGIHGIKATEQVGQGMAAIKVHLVPFSPASVLTGWLSKAEQYS